MRLICGDILTPTTNGDTVVLHQVNCKGVMGAGLAKQIREKFPDVYNAYKDMCNNGSAKLGYVQFCRTDAGYLICNCFAQDKYGRDKQYTDYDAIRKCFIKVCGAFKDFTVRIPYKIGCGLGGGDWNIVSKIIHEELVNKGVDVEIWAL